MAKTSNFIVNARIHGQKPGDVIRLKVDDDGVPCDKNWRRRFHDAAYDNCLTPQPKSKPKPATDTKQEIK